MRRVCIQKARKIIAMALGLSLGHEPCGGPGLSSGRLTALMGPMGVQLRHILRDYGTPLCSWRIAQDVAHAVFIECRARARDRIKS